MAEIMKKTKIIKVDADKCTGCRTCEIICSAFHSTPRYSSNSPAKARIQIITDRLNNKWLPVFAGEYVPAECMGRNKYIIDGKEYDECDFCRAVCPSRDLFKEPDSGFPLKCDMCEDVPAQEEPLCVQWCINDVLVYEEIEEEVEEEEALKDIETKVQLLIDKHGIKDVVDKITRMSRDDYEEEVEQGETEIRLRSLVDQYGLKYVEGIIARMNRDDREKEVAGEQEEIEKKLLSLVDKYGLEYVNDIIARMSQNS
jgi:Fe-S-cluster-containing dehydrogenase component